MILLKINKLIVNQFDKGLIFNKIYSKAERKLILMINKFVIQLLENVSSQIMGAGISTKYGLLLSKIKWLTSIGNLNNHSLRTYRDFISS